jgi:hypothetical protein
MPANPEEARQVGRHIADRTIIVFGRNRSQACRDGATPRHACFFRGVLTIGSASGFRPRTASE